MRTSARKPQRAGRFVEHSAFVAVAGLEQQRRLDHVGPRAHVDPIRKAVERLVLLRIAFRIEHVVHDDIDRPYRRAAALELGARDGRLGCGRLFGSGKLGSGRVPPAGLRPGRGLGSGRVGVLRERAQCEQPQKSGRRRSKRVEAWAHRRLAYRVRAANSADRYAVAGAQLV
jgi:hypothetical protein